MKKNNPRDVECPHYKGDGYHYDVRGKTPFVAFWFCDRCNNKLMEMMIKQKKLEEECKIMFNKKLNKKFEPLRVSE